MPVIHFSAIWDHDDMKYVLPAVPFLMLRIHPAIREDVSFHGLTCPLKLYQYLWHLLEEKPWYIADHCCLWPTSNHDGVHYSYWETMALSLMYECSPSVDHAMYKILTATRIAIDINYPSLQIPTSYNYFDVKDWSFKEIRGFSLWSDLLVKLWCQW